jgi:hypothetical protein
LKSYEYIGNLDSFESYVRIGYNTYKDDKQLSTTPNENNKKDNTSIYFTKDQEKTYREFLINRPDILSEIINDVLGSKLKT